MLRRSISSVQARVREDYHILFLSFFFFCWQTVTFKWLKFTYPVGEQYYCGVLWCITVLIASEPTESAVCHLSKVPAAIHYAIVERLLWVEI